MHLQEKSKKVKMNGKHHGKKIGLATMLKCRRVVCSQT